MQRHSSLACLRMKPRIFVWRWAFELLLVLSLFVPGNRSEKRARADGDSFVRVAVKAKVPLTAALVAELAQYGQINRHLSRLNLLDMQVPTEMLHQLAANPRVQYVEPDQEVRLLAADSDLPVLDFTVGASHWNLDMINVTDSALNPDPIREAPTRVVDYDGEGVYVAVVDSGLVPDWRDYFPEDRIDQVHATSFTGGAVTDRRWEKDTNSHGTAVTSVILGYRFTESGEFAGAPPFPFNVNGVAAKATIIPVKVSLNKNGGGFASVFDAAAGIEYVGRLRESGEIEAPIVINASWGTLLPSQSIEEAIDYAIAQGVIVVACAGNEGLSGMVYPAAHPQVISVGATGWNKEWTSLDWVAVDVSELPDVPEPLASESYIANFSSRQKGHQQLDLVAPGAAVFGPYVYRGAASPDTDRAHNANFGFLGGTSLASPHAAGVAALLLEKNPHLNQFDVEAILQHSAIPVPPGTHVDSVGWIAGFGFGSLSVWGDCRSGYCPEEQGAGLLQADRALDLTWPW